MTAHDNSVNIAAAERSYHHGDLRSALIAAGLDALRLGSADALSLRALAREAGVSATAVYRHFPDKEALLAALALAGFDRMAAAQQAASCAAAGQGALAAFCASGAAYVRFAIINPELFRLMWKAAPRGDQLDLPIEKAHPAMADLRRAVNDMAPPGASEDDKRATALRCWGLVHGLATLTLDEQIELEDEMIDRVIAGLAERMRG
ncbi:TetR/AcrR family transcriptional regulator [Sphingomonas lacunae]|uniref:TetR/AcrR family transcriptional regulator n=1 Tax=Sphingomonas lacunae TaxID=2698828 RepID=A0A6M4AWB0_9SPHN|nr:TetR/AcrR family transcriptional regulator [Sphingomonas lacunae]QJQ33437.1 TetR/AcrR family transcriptional regulator [Sphingomonas lacunae]